MSDIYKIVDIRIHMIHETNKIEDTKLKNVENGQS